MQWVVLERDQLVTAAGIFESADILAGESERAVLIDVRDHGTMSTAVKVRLARDPALRQRCEVRVDGASHGPAGDLTAHSIRTSLAEHLDAVERKEYDILVFKCLHRLPDDVEQWIARVEQRTAFVHLKLPQDGALDVGKVIVVEAMARGFTAREKTYRGSGYSILITR